MADDTIFTEFEDGIPTYHCRDATELIEILNISSDLWLKPNATKSEWVFRGQPDSTFKLIPTAMRMNREPNYFDMIRKFMSENYTRLLGQILEALRKQYRRNEDYEKIAVVLDDMEADAETLETQVFQILTEIYVILQFVDTANEIGFPLPIDKYVDGIQQDFLPYLVSQFRQQFEEAINEDRDIQYVSDTEDDTEKEVDDIFIRVDYPASQIVGLAQHHGIPTRLLDWSFNPLVATYFASEPHLPTVRSSSNSEAENLAIWALNYQTKLYQYEIQYVQAWRNQNVYLHAQDGLFTHDLRVHRTYPYGADNKMPYRPLEDIFSESPMDEREDYIRKITLPSTESTELTRRLSAHRVGQHYLMPTLDNVANAVKFNLSELYPVSTE